MVEASVFVDLLEFLVVELGHLVQHASEVVLSAHELGGSKLVGRHPLHGVSLVVRIMEVRLV